MIALIDSDIVSYRAAFAAEKVRYNVYVEGEEDYGYVVRLNSREECNTWLQENPDGKFFIESEKEIGDESISVMAAKATMESILNTLQTNEYRAYLTGTGNYREKLATIKPYKGNRRPEDKPKHLPAVREYLLKRWNATMIHGSEADDAIGVMQYRDWVSYADLTLTEVGPLERHSICGTIICSIDKDLKMIPGWHFNFVTGEKVFIDEVTGIRNFYKQLLTGDTTDNIPGLYHITGKKCKKEYIAMIDGVSTEEEMYSYVLDMYLRGTPEEDKQKVISSVNEIANLLWIQREEDVFWQPPI